MAKRLFVRRVVRSEAAALVSVALAFMSVVAEADEVNRYVAQEQQLYELPAVVLGVIRDGRLIDARASGLANVELGVKQA